MKEYYINQILKTIEENNLSARELKLILVFAEHLKPKNGDAE